MLQAEHNRNRYERPVLARRKQRRAADGMVPSLTPVHQQMDENQPRDLGDANELTLDEFVALYLDARDELAYRQLSGETLSHREGVMLVALNQLLERLLPAPAPLPKHVTMLVDEILRRL